MGERERERALPHVGDQMIGVHACTVCTLECDVQQELLRIIAVLELFPLGWVGGESLAILGIAFNVLNAWGHSCRGCPARAPRCRRRHHAGAPCLGLATIPLSVALYSLVNLPFRRGIWGRWPHEWGWSATLFLSLPPLSIIFWKGQIGKMAPCRS